jgi:hypothetical protein
VVEARRHTSAKPDSSLTGIISITIRVRRAFRNVMKPWFQGVLTPWKSGFMASATGPTLMIKLSGMELE